MNTMHTLMSASQGQRPAFIPAWGIAPGHRDKMEQWAESPSHRSGESEWIGLSALCHFASRILGLCPRLVWNAPLAQRPGWSTRLGCCLRPLAADTGRRTFARRHRRGSGSNNIRCAGCTPASDKDVGRCVLEARAPRKQHASRVLHPGNVLRRRLSLA